MQLTSRLKKKDVPNENKGYYDSLLDSIGDVKLHSQKTRKHVSQLILK